MVDLNSLPQTTLRHDPWVRANMMGETVHCSYFNTATAGPSLYVENSGSAPLAIALSFWGSVAYDASVYTNCNFTGSSQRAQHLVNRYAQAAHGYAASQLVLGPLIPYTAGASFTGNESLIWSAAAGQRLTPFGPNGFTGVFLILDAAEKLRFALARTDGLSDSQDWNIDVTWTGWDFNALSLGVFG